jgi:hypothetical protein
MQVNYQGKHIIIAGTILQLAAPFVVLCKSPHRRCRHKLATVLEVIARPEMKVLW